MVLIYLKMSKAFVFPGQGSQYVGMGQDLFESYPEVRDLYLKSGEILGYDISAVSFEGPEEKLKQTYITQPAIVVHSAAIILLLKNKKIEAGFAAGHSLGEFSALIYAGALSFEDGLKLVQLRGELMQKAGEENKGTMAAIVGLDTKTVERICKEASASGIVQVANFNSPGQIVISGSVEGVRKAMELAKKNKAKLVKELVVHGAFHSPLMESAREDFRVALDFTDFNKVKIPVYTNVTGMPITQFTGLEEIKESLYNQLTSSVRWNESIMNMIKDGAKEFIEIGPGKVLQGLVKRIDNTVIVKGFDKADNLKSF
jgi:[acyl-carrier-protein] S-malonyltransferase